MAISKFIEDTYDKNMYDYFLLYIVRGVLNDSKTIIYFKSGLK